MSAVHLQRVSRNSTAAISLAEQEAPGRRDSHMSPTQAFGRVIEEAVIEGLKKALNVSDVTGRRLVTAKQAALYLCLSEREIYNMISSRELCDVRHGRRLMLDIRDLERWIETNKV